MKNEEIKYIDYDKVKTFEDLKLIIECLNPKAFKGTEEYIRLKHLF